MAQIATPITQDGSPFCLVQPGATQSVAYTATAGTIASAVGADVVRIVSTTDCHVAFGAAPTATTDDFFLPAKSPELFSINRAHKVSAIRSASDGMIYVTSATEVVRA